MDQQVLLGMHRRNPVYFFSKGEFPHDIHTHGSGGFRNWLAISQIPGKFHEKVVDSLH